MSNVEGYDEVPSFDAIADLYDDSFFSKHSLLLIYVPAASGSFRFGVREVIYDEESLCVSVEQVNHPEVYTADMAGWFVLVELESAPASCTDFDAILLDS